MNEISSEELKKKIDNKVDFKLVFCMKEDYFRKKHIPGSILMDTYRERALDLPNFRKEIQQVLDIDDEIIVYCSDVACGGSIAVYQQLEQMHYKNITRFSGGLREWEDAGYLLVGEMVD